MSKADREAFQDFLFHEARLLDERRFREWMALFTDDGVYWVPASPDQKSPLTQASLFYDDRPLMATRIERLEHPLIHVQSPPSQTVHLVSNIAVREADETAGTYTIASNMIMTEFRQDQQRMFAGRQLHQLRREGNLFRIAHKRVDLVNCQGAFEAMAVPI